MAAAFNQIFLDAGPAAALLVLFILWMVRNRRCRREEKELRERIGQYQAQGQETEGAERPCGGTERPEGAVPPRSEQA